MMFHPPNPLMDQQQQGTPFGTPSKKYILAEMPIEYSQHHQHHQQMANNNNNQHQQLQDAVTNVSPPMFQTNLHNNANGLMGSNNNNNTGNCVILLSSSHPVVAMHSKSRTLLIPIIMQI